MKSWRPPNWENPYGSSSSDKVVRPIRAYELSAFEAGADAMHKAVIKWIIEHQKASYSQIIGVGRFINSEDWQEFTKV